MAADQRRKRLSGANIAGLGSREHYRTKKKKMDSPDNSLNTRTHISLEWESRQKKVVARREQVGLSLRDLRPFVDSIPRGRNFLGDVCVVPQEIFELENLSEVLSYEAWRSHLSEAERNLLRQFLPEGTDVDQVVQTLLTGDNFHFGNPFLEWGTAVCSGDIHPDAILCQAQRLKDDKRAYFSELQKYHYDMIDHLQKLKERWESCKDPEKEIVQNMWGRLRGETAHANDSHQELEQDLTAASESCSWNDADEKPCSSDNKSSSVLMTGELKKRSRIFDKAVENEKYGNSSIALDNVLNMGAKAGKKDKQPKHSIHKTDGAKYMSYLKISKKQHQIVTSMKQSGKSIQSRSLNRILGNVNKLDVQPYEVFVEEEQKKLHVHWLQLVKDLPAAYAIWKEIQLLKWEMAKSLERDLKAKLDPWVEDEQKQDAENILQKIDKTDSYSSDEEPVKDRHESSIQNQNNVIASESEPNTEDSGDSGHQSAQNQSSPSQDMSLYGGHEFELKDEEHDADSVPGSPLLQSMPQGSPPRVGLDVKLDDIEDKPGPGFGSPQNKPSPRFSSVPSSLQDQSFSQTTPVTDGHAIKLSDMDPISKHNVPTLENASVVMSEPSGNENVTGITSSCGGPFPSGEEVWPAVEIGRSYIDSTPSHQAYASTSGGLSLVHPQVNGEKNTSFVDLGDVNKDGRKNILQRQSNDGSFCSFPNQDRNDLLQSLFKSQGMQSHNLEQLQSLFKDHGMPSCMPSRNQGLDLQPPSDVIMDGTQYSGHFQDQMRPLHPMTQEQKGLNEFYLQQNTSDNIYSDGNRYLMPRPGGVQDWNAANMRMALPIQSQLNGNEILNQNWLSSEHQLPSMWSGSNGGVSSQGGIQSDQNLHRGSNSDQTLFSVLSQCNQQESIRPFDSVSSTEQLIAPRNYGIMMGGGASGISTNVPQAPHPLGYLGGGNPAPSLMPDDVRWMNQTHQNSALHDPLGKLYQRSWNQ